MVTVVFNTSVALLASKQVVGMEIVVVRTCHEKFRGVGPGKGSKPTRR